MSEPYHYTECGLDYVYLLDGFTFSDTPRGRTVRFHDIDDLHRAIGHFIVSGRRRLSGREIRFLRHELGLSQAALGQLLDVTERTVARWERGIAPPRTAELAIRTLYQEQADGGARVADQLQQMAGLEDSTDQQLNLVDDENGWSEAA